MPRSLRIDLPGGWYHVTARGNERKPIFLDDRDRTHFLELLDEMVARYTIRLHAYVLMDNHYHLMLETPHANLSRAMQWLNVSYSVWFNRRRQRVGHLLQGRFKAVVLEPQSWAAGLSRYVHLNPVRVARLGLDKPSQRVIRAGLAGRPDADVVKQRIVELRRYPWSSYRAYLGLASRPRWLMCQAVLEWVGGGNGLGQRRAYRAYVEQAVREGLGESPWDAVEAGLVLGGGEFVGRIRSKLRVAERGGAKLGGLAQRPGFDRVKAVVSELKGERWEDYRDRQGDWGRDATLYVARKRCGLGLRELGEAVGGVGATSVSMAVKRMAARLESEKKLRTLIEQAVKRLGL